jgi:hypothetical protein
VQEVRTMAQSNAAAQERRLCSRRDVRAAGSGEGDAKGLLGL